MEKYINFFNKCANYYIENAKNELQKTHINRKIEHSKRVNKMSVEIAEKQGLSEKEIYLINIASLLHDIGRFKQFYEYSTYIDEISCNHALLGIEILEQEKVLDDITLEEKNIVLEIIKLHNYKELPEKISEKLCTYANIIRDADKIDWLYAMVNIIPKLAKEDQAVFYSRKEDKKYISEKIVNKVISDQTITKAEIETIDEYRAVAIGWLTSNIKNKQSYEIIKREDLINKIYDLMADTKEKEIIFEHVKKSIEEI